MGFWRVKRVSDIQSKVNQGHVRRKALWSLWTSLRKPRTSSFSFPVSLYLKSSYSSSFSSCSNLALWVKAATTVLDPEEAVFALNVDSWERRIEETAGGRDKGVADEGTGWDGR